MVLGGYSQGAAVIAYITTDTIPPGFALPAGITVRCRHGGPARRCGHAVRQAVERVL